MQVSIEVATKGAAKLNEPFQPSKVKSDCEINSDKLKAAHEEVQRARKALADLLEPAVMAAKNGELSDKTPDEIFEEVMKTVAENMK